MSASFGCLSCNSFLLQMADMKEIAAARICMKMSGAFELVVSTYCCWEENPIIPPKARLRSLSRSVSKNQCHSGDDPSKDGCNSHSLHVRGLAAYPVFNEFPVIFLRHHRDLLEFLRGWVKSYTRGPDLPILATNCWQTNRRCCNNRGQSQ